MVASGDQESRIFFRPELRLISKEEQNYYPAEVYQVLWSQW